MAGCAAEFSDQQQPFGDGRLVAVGNCVIRTADEWPNSILPGCGSGQDQQQEKCKDHCAFITISIGF